MRMRIAVAVVLVCAPMLANAVVMELSPGLYLVIRERERRESNTTFKIAVIDEANRLAASQGKVVVPVASRASWDGSFLRDYEYQFRLLSRAEALEVKPTLADVVVALDSSSCDVRAASTVAALRDRGLLAAGEPKEETEQDAPAPAPIPEVPWTTPGVPDPMKPWLPPPVPDPSAQ